MKWLLSIAFISFSALGAESSLVLRLKKATIDFGRGDYDAVIKSLNPYSVELPNPGLMILGNSYSKKQKYADEVRVLKILAARNENSYQAQMLLGQGLLKEAMAAKDRDAASKIEIDAIKAFRTCLKLRPNFNPAFDELL